MRCTQFLSLFVLLIVLASCSQPSKGEDEREESLNFPVLAELIIQRIELQPGEKVLLVAEPGRFDPLIEALAEGVSMSSGEYLGCMSVSETQPSAWSSPFIVGARDLDDQALQDDLKKVDIGIMLPGATPSDRVYGLMQENLKDSIGRTIHFHWSGAYDLDGNAMELTPEMNALYQASLLSTDYAKLAADQLAFEQAMRGEIVRVTTPAGTDISFEIGDRPVTKQNGDASAATAARARNLIDREMELPAGAIRVAPVESTVNGVIFFPDWWVNDAEVKGQVLTFEKGKVVDMIAESGLDAVRVQMDSIGEAARSFREFALGFNSTLAIPEEDPWIPYYGYGAGVVRLSLGDNTELGGNIGGGYVKWNFFPNATVMVGDEVWVTDGKIVHQ